MLAHELQKKWRAGECSVPSRRRRRRAQVAVEAHADDAEPGQPSSKLQQEQPPVEASVALLSHMLLRAVILLGVGHV